MNEQTRKTEAFIEAHALGPKQIETANLVSAFLSEMELGLVDEERSSLKMIATYTSVVDSLPVDTPVIVIDAGGTNLRSCLVSFDAAGKPIVSDFRKTSMPGVKEEVSSEEFFSALADCCEHLIEQSDQIGFCFSYAAKIHSNRDGVPLIFSKEIKAPSVIGMPVGASLLAELARRGYDVSKKRIAVLNDTVATLLAGVSAQNELPYSGYIGFILGTGTNTAYVESNEKIEKLELPQGSQIINVESGGFSYCPGSVDRAYFDSTEHPEHYLLEKMISGAYIGPLSHAVITHAIEANLFSEGFAQRFADLKTLSTAEMSNYLEMPFNSEYVLVSCVAENEADAHTLWLLIDSLIGRAAKLTAASLAATVIKQGVGKDPRHPVLINADGTTFYKTENLQRYTDYYLYEYLTLERGYHYRFTQIADSPTIGAAIAALGI